MQKRQMMDHSVYKRFAPSVAALFTLHHRRESEGIWNIKSAQQMMK